MAGRMGGGADRSAPELARLARSPWGSVCSPCTPETLFPPHQLALAVPISPPAVSIEQFAFVVEVAVSEGVAGAVSQGCERSGRVRARILRILRGACHEDVGRIPYLAV